MKGSVSIGANKSRSCFWQNPLNTEVSLIPLRTSEVGPSISLEYRSVPTVYTWPFFAMGRSIPSTDRVCAEMMPPWQSFVGAMHCLMLNRFWNDLIRSAAAFGFGKSPMFISETHPTPCHSFSNPASSCQPFSMLFSIGRPIEHIGYSYIE